MRKGGRGGGESMGSPYSYLLSVIFFIFFYFFLPFSLLSFSHTFWFFHGHIQGSKLTFLLGSTGAPNFKKLGAPKNF